MMNISIRRLPAIALWFTIFISLFALALFKMPDNYRIHPQLQKPSIMFLKPGVPGLTLARYTSLFKSPIKEGTFCLVGDSAAWCAPWACFKIAVLGSLTDSVIEAVERSALPNQCKTFVVMNGIVLAGTGYTPDAIDRDNERLKAAILKKYPGSKVNIIPMSEWLKIASAHTVGDGYHLNKTGYAILRLQFSHFFIAE